jgi:hypothetical protein
VDSEWWIKLKVVGPTWSEHALYKKHEGCVATITVGESQYHIPDKIVEALNKEGRMQMAKKVVVSDVSDEMWNNAVAVANKLMRTLKESADAIAVQLYHEKVRGAKCGDANKCALAQYIANQMPPGIEVIVMGNVGLRAVERYEDIELTPAASLFVDNFDAKQYGFLQ